MNDLELERNNCLNLRFLDKAAILEDKDEEPNYKIAPAVRQVEELKIRLRLLPLWLIDHSCCFFGHSPTEHFQTWFKPNQGLIRSERG